MGALLSGIHCGMSQLVFIHQSLRWPPYLSTHFCPWGLSPCADMLVSLPLGNLWEAVCTCLPDPLGSLSCSGVLLPSGALRPLCSQNPQIYLACLQILTDLTRSGPGSSPRTHQALSTSLPPLLPHSIQGNVFWCDNKIPHSPNL